jgi:hypothetical protein
MVKAIKKNKKNKKALGVRKKPTKKSAANKKTKTKRSQTESNNSNANATRSANRQPRSNNANLNKSANRSANGTTNLTANRTANRTYNMVGPGKVPVTRGANGFYYAANGKRYAANNVKAVSRLNKYEQTYRLFNNTNTLFNNQFANELASSMKPRAPPPVCGDEAAGGLATEAFGKCLQQKLGPKLNAIFAESSKALSERRMCFADAQGRPTGDASLKLGAHQILVYNVAKLIANYDQVDDQFMPNSKTCDGVYAGSKNGNKIGGHRGMLVWHNTGSGKTVTATGIILAYLEHSKKRIYVVTTVENRKNNNAGTYAANIALFFPDWPGLPARDANAKGKPGDDKEWIASIAAFLRRRVKWMSYEEFANSIGVASSGGQFVKYAHTDYMFARGPGSVVLMDEAQSIATPDRAAESTNNLKKLFTADPADKSSDRVFKEMCLTNAAVGARAVLDNVHVYALTATPGNSVKEWLDIMTFVRRKDQKPFTEAAWGKTLGPGDFRGLISYVEMRDDRSKFAAVKAFNVAVPMDPPYFGAYLSILAKMQDSQFEVNPQKPSDFLKDLRKAGTWLNKTGPGGYATWYKGEALARAKSRGLLIPGLAGQEKLVSTKFKVMMDKVMEAEGKQYVYTSTASEMMMVQVLNANGYKPVTEDDLDELSSGKTDDQGRDIKTFKVLLKGSPAKRYVLYKDSAASKSILDKMRTLYSSSKNLNGEYCKILIATGTNYQGLDLTALRGVHILDPLFSDIADQQAFGRGQRNCGHAMLPAEKRNVAIYRYWSVPPAGTPGSVLKMIVDQVGGEGGKNPGYKTLEAAAKKMMDKFGLQNLKDGGNTALYDYGFKRGEELRKFELCIKGVALDCALFKQAWHSKQPFACSAGSSKSCPAVSNARSSNTRANAAQTLVISVPTTPSPSTSSSSSSAASKPATNAGKQERDWLMNVAKSMASSKSSAAKSMASGKSSAARSSGVTATQSANKPSKTSKSAGTVTQVSRVVPTYSNSGKRSGTLVVVRQTVSKPAGASSRTVTTTAAPSSSRTVTVAPSSNRTVTLISARGREDPLANTAASKPRKLKQN